MFEKRGATDETQNQVKNQSIICILSTPETIIISGVIWTPYDWLNKFSSCYMATLVGIVNGCGFGIDTCHEN